MRLTDRLGGHLVQGHVDGVGEIVDAPRPTCGSRIPADLLRYVVHKGSITVDGVQPHRRRPFTTTDSRSPSSPTQPMSRPWVAKGAGDRVNLEVDMIAKYVERLLPGRRR